MITRKNITIATRGVPDPDHPDLELPNVRQAGAILILRAGRQYDSTLFRGEGEDVDDMVKATVLEDLMRKVYGEPVDFLNSLKDDILDLASGPPTFDQVKRIVHRIEEMKKRMTYPQDQ